MRLRINLFQLVALVLAGMVFSMCSTDEGVKPSDDVLITGRGLISGGTSTTVYLTGLSDKNELVSLTVSHSAVETGLVPITGLRDGEFIIAIDKAKELFGLSNQSAVYKINATTGVARPLGGNFTPALSGELFGFDVNPSDNVIRVMTTGGQNLRISTTTGQVIGEDAAWHITPLSINSIGYLPILIGGKAVLYALDIAAGKLYKQAPAGTGFVTLVGSTGYDWRLEGGFDILSNGVGYTVQYGHNNGTGGTGVDAGGDTTLDDYRIHSINLKTGKATSLGSVRPMIGLTVR